MTHYRRDIRVSRLRVLRALFSRRGLVLELRIEADGPFLAVIDDDPPPRSACRAPGCTASRYAPLDEHTITAHHRYDNRKISP